jgi:hypothetical protein
MDTSADEYAVAALLDGRMGIWCNLQYARKSPEDVSSTVPLTGAETPVTPHRSSDEGVEGETPPPFKSINIRWSFEEINLEDVHDAHNYYDHDINQTWNLKVRPVPIVSETKVHAEASPSQGIPVEPGPSTIYRDLCQPDDPPRSVAICPRRRAVAFGCSARIELHWIDKDSNSVFRRFPLTAPSDIVYFLPPLPGDESPKKLRLISSAALPRERPQICRKFYPPKDVDLCLGALRYADAHDIAKQPKYDHYRAVPLSDGRHMLFIDPKSRDLFLGSDAPLHAPTKLLRKIRFETPVEGQTARLYTAAADLSWGVRIVAVYGDAIIFYSVPRDIFESPHWEQNNHDDDAEAASAVDDDENHWSHWLSPPHHDLTNPIAPLTIRGIHLGTMQQLSELAIFTDPDITIWAFSLAGMAKTWQVRSSTPPRASTSSREKPDERSVEYDGHESVRTRSCGPKALLCVDQDGGVSGGGGGGGRPAAVISGFDGWYDMDGAVLCFDDETETTDTLEEEVRKWSWWEEG